MPIAKTIRTNLLFMLAGFFVAAAALGCVVLMIHRKPVEKSLGNIVVRSQKGVHVPFEVPEGEALDSWSGATSTGGRDQTSPEERTGVRNLILFIGDGMGFGMASTASTVLHGPSGGLVLEAAPVIGASRVAATNTLVPDSAAGGTALATGFKTDKLVVSTLRDGRELRTILEAAHLAGLATGVVTTSYLTDATPACFSTHSRARTDYEGIFSGMLESGIDILAGGDSGFGTYWGGAGVRAPDEWGPYNLVRSESEFLAAELPILGLFPKRNGNESEHGPALALSTRRAIDLLAANETGFVMMIETEITDELAHANDAERVIEGVRELDEAVAVALEFASAREDTLVLVTADHDTGGMSIEDGPYRLGMATIRWVTNGHTADWVPIFAFGNGAEFFGGVHDASEVGRTMGRVLGLENFPAIITEESVPMDVGEANDDY